MPTSTIYFTSQGRVAKSTGGTPFNSWAAVRGNSTTIGSSVGTGTSDQFGCRMTAARGGSVLTENNRAYFYFNLSSIGTTITAMEFKVRGGNNSANLNGDWTVARANGDDDFGTIATSDYPLVWNSSATLTSYGAQQNSWSGNADNTIDLNATAITNANNNNELCICLMNYTYDYNNGSVEESFGNIYNSLNFVTSGTTRARLIIDHAAPTQYPNKVNGIIPALLQKINGEQVVVGGSQNVEKVNGRS